MRNTWVEARGGVYLFVPSVSALRLIATGERVEGV
jgi:hypothetical protein